MNKLKIGDKIVIVLILVASLGLSLYFLLGTPKGLGEEVIVEVGGEVVKTITLPQENFEWNYLADDGDHNLIQIKGHQVRIVEASCPDQVCTNEGWKSKPGSTIVCLPHKLIVKVVGERADEYEIDGTTF